MSGENYNAFQTFGMNKGQGITYGYGGYTMDLFSVPVYADSDISVYNPNPNQNNNKNKNKIQYKKQNHENKIRRNTKYAISYNIYML